MGTFDGEFGGDDDGVELLVLLRAGVGGAWIGCTFTLHSLEWRFGKLKVFVHCDRLRTIFELLKSRIFNEILKLFTFFCKFLIFIIHQSWTFFGFTVCRQTKWIFNIQHNWTLKRISHRELLTVDALEWNANFCQNIFFYVHKDFLYYNNNFFSS